MLEREISGALSWERQPKTRWTGKLLRKPFAHNLICWSQIYLKVFLFLVALQALKRKKRYETQLEQLQGQLTTIEVQREALENANTNQAVLETMKGAADALKKTHKDMNVDNVHELMDDIAEQNDVANEISQAISSGIIGTNVDDDELAKELEALEQEELDKDLLNVGPTPNKLPDVPSTDLPSTSKDKEKKKGLGELIDDASANDSLEFIYLFSKTCRGRQHRRWSRHERADAMGELEGESLFRPMMSAPGLLNIIILIMSSLSK